MRISLAASIIDHLDIQHHKNVTVKQIYDLVPSEKLIIPRLHALTTLLLLERERTELYGKGVKCIHNVRRIKQGFIWSRFSFDQSVVNSGGLCINSRIGEGQMVNRSTVFF